jgi:EPS-associated MarR family transcriptional regulator
MSKVKQELMTEREETDFRVLRALSSGSDLSQREIAQQVGISLGAVNYCLKALTDKGFVKVQNFRSSKNRIGYVYLLTPKGISQKTALAFRFIRRKLAEFERLKEEIAEVSKECGLDD